MMPANKVIEVLEALEGKNLSVWIDGGWGVDALVGRQTRDHADLDLAVLLNETPDVIALLHDLGYETFEDEMPTRLDMRSKEDSRVDLHPLKFDEEGNGQQQLQDGSFGTYTAAGLKGTGIIGGRRVACLSRDLQLCFHDGYELDDDDKHDVELLKRLSN